ERGADLRPPRGRDRRQRARRDAAVRAPRRRDRRGEVRAPARAARLRARGGALMVAPRKDYQSEQLRREQEIATMRRGGIEPPSTATAGTTRPAVDRDEARATDDVTGLLSELTRETTLLMHQEVALVRAEMDEKVQRLEKGAI